MIGKVHLPATRVRLRTNRPTTSRGGRTNRDSHPRTRPMLTTLFRAVTRSCTAAPKAALRPRTVLRLECLEGREVPATCTVSNTNANGAGSLDAAVTAANTHMDASAI